LQTEKYRCGGEFLRLIEEMERKLYKLREGRKLAEGNEGGIRG
jgi:hypothetical protein